MVGIVAGAVVACVAVVALLAVGGAFGSGVLGRGAPSVAPDTWARSVCSALNPWRSQVADLTAQANGQISGTSTPVQTKQSLATLLAGAEGASERARRRVVAAGVPQVADGEAVADQVVAALARARDAYGHAKNRIAGLDPTRAGPFYDAVANAFAKLSEEHKSSTLNVRELGPAPLRRAFDQVSECR